MNSNAVKTRKMMGEYIVYYDGVVIGGLYDNRLLVKATKSARHQLQDNALVSPYPGAKEMILIPDFAEATNITNLFECIKMIWKLIINCHAQLFWKVSISHYQIIEYLDLLLYTNSIFVIIELINIINWISNFTKLEWFNSITIVWK